MGTFGDRLRREREMRGITLDEISESTKISRRHLESLEKEEFDNLPGKVFAKGFVRAYARYLGISEDQAAADYALANPEPVAAEEKFPLEIHQKPNRELNPKKPRLPLVLAMAALVGVLIGYGVWAKSRARQQETPEKVSAAARDDRVSSTPAPAQIVQAAANTVTEEPPVSAATSEAKPVQPVTEEKAAQKPQARNFFVVVKAKEDSWVSLTVDGHTRSFVLKTDRQRLEWAGSKIIVNTRNAGGIDISFNGRSLGSIGNENEPRTLTFTTAGLVQ